MTMWYELFINGEDLPAAAINRQGVPELEDFLSECNDLGKIVAYEIREWLSKKVVVVKLAHERDVMRL